MMVGVMGALLARGSDNDRGAASHRRASTRDAWREALFSIVLMNYEAELHSSAWRSGRGGNLPERGGASQLSARRDGNGRHPVGDQPDDPCARGAHRGAAV